MNQEFPVDAIFSVKKDWTKGGGFTGKISLTNNGKSLNRWTFEFDAPFEITKIWNAEIVSHVGNHYIIKNGNWNDDISTKETVHFGFNAKVDNRTITEPTNYIFNQQPLEPVTQESNNSKPSPSEDSQVIGEIGTINDLTHLSQTIELKNQYENPVVFALPVSQNGGAPAIARITDIESDNFSVYIQEPNYQDKFHPKESFSYMVVEEGTWELNNGKILQVGTVDAKNTTTTSRWKTINFQTGFDSTPVILSQTQTDNDSTFVRTRQQKASASGVQLALEEEEKLNQSGHGKESVGWLAMEQGAGTWNGMKYQAATTGNQVTNKWQELDFSGFTKAPKLLAGLASYHGVDSAGLRSKSLNSDGVEIRVEEDTSLDIETNHKNEIVNFLAIEGSKNLTGTAFEPQNNDGKDDKNEDKPLPSPSPSPSDKGVSRPDYNKSEGFFVLDGNIYDANGNKFIPRGVNSMHMWFDKWKDGQPTGKAYRALDNISEFGVNSVRINWRMALPYSGATNDNMLEAIITEAIDNNMVPIVSLHDVTGSNDKNDLLKRIVPWWTERAHIWKKYEKHLIIDIVNEFGGNVIKHDREAFPQLYSSAISTIRKAGIDNTLFVEPFEWAKDTSFISEYGQKILNSDPQKNVAFSPHMYCGLGADSKRIEAEFDEISGKGLAMAVGEFAHRTKPTCLSRIFEQSRE